MAASERAVPDTLRSLAEGSISGTYAAVGSSFPFPARYISFINNTDGDMFFSLDGINDHFFVAKNTYKLIDISSNRDNVASAFCFAAGTIVYVRQSSAASTGSVYVEMIYGE